MTLTSAERLWLAMRRAGRRRTDVARAAGVRPGVVSSWLRGRAEPPEALIAGAREKLTRGEREALRRRREGMSIRESAARYGISHVTLIRYEHDRGGPDGTRAIEAYWAARSRSKAS